MDKRRQFQPNCPYMMLKSLQAHWAESIGRTDGAWPAMINRRLLLAICAAQLNN